MLNVVLMCAQMKHSLDLRRVLKVTFCVPLNKSVRLIFVCLFLSYQSASVIAHTLCSHPVLALLGIIFEKINETQIYFKLPDSHENKRTTKPFSLRFTDTSPASFTFQLRSRCAVHCILLYNYRSVTPVHGSSYPTVNYLPVHILQ